VVTLLDMAAEGSGAAGADVAECPQLRSGEAPLLAEELLFVLAKDIGDFEPMSAHSGSSPSVLLRGFSASASNGLDTACILFVETRR
jgi:hypothetical protein